MTVCLGEETTVPAVVQKLRAEKIPSVKLDNVGPRQVVEFMHERLTAHAKKTGYELVWNAPEALPEEPKVVFGMENGSLALLVETR
jgi:hypothetical protein